MHGFLTIRYYVESCVTGFSFFITAISQFFFVFFLGGGGGGGGISITRKKLPYISAPTRKITQFSDCLWPRPLFQHRFRAYSLFVFIYLE